jgi:hypothetical protein
MEYEEYGLVAKKMYFADFHVSGLFMTKKHDLSVKNVSVCHASLPV